MRKILMLSTILTVSAHALAFCLQPQPPSICAEYFRSRLVVEATAVTRKHLTVREMGLGAGSDGELYTFEVETVYRGPAVKTIKVVDENDSGRIAFTVRNGGKYLLFLNNAHQSGWYVADGCGNSGNSNRQSKMLAQVESFAHAPDDALVEVNVAAGPGLQGPLADAAVTLSGNKTSTVKTDKYGWARFSIPLGSYSATASKPGWNVTQYDLPYEDANHIQLKEHGQCSQLQFWSIPN